MSLTGNGEQPETPGSSIQQTSAELKKKRRQRRGHKAYIKTVLSAAAELLTAELDPKNTLRLRQQKITLEERLKTIRELDNQILDLLIEEQDIELEITDAGQFSDLIYETILKLKTFLLQVRKKRKRQKVPHKMNMQSFLVVSLMGEQRQNYQN